MSAYFLKAARSIQAVFREVAFSDPATKQAATRMFENCPHTHQEQPS
jgi:hypothetical protein